MSTVRIFPPDDVVPEPEFRGAHHLPATAVRSVVEQLYALNRRLIALEGRLMRLAGDYGVKREIFLKHYYGHEQNPTWLETLVETRFLVLTRRSAFARNA